MRRWCWIIVLVALLAAPLTATAAQPGDDGAEAQEFTLLEEEEPPVLISEIDIPAVEGRGFPGKASHAWVHSTGWIPNLVAAGLRANIAWNNPTLRGCNWPWSQDFVNQHISLSNGSQTAWVLVSWDKTCDIDYPVVLVEFKDSDGDVKQLRYSVTQRSYNYRIAYNAGAARWQVYIDSYLLATRSSAALGMTPANAAWYEIGGEGYPYCCQIIGALYPTKGYLSKLKYQAVAGGVWSFLTPNVPYISPYDPANYGTERGYGGAVVGWWIKNWTLGD